MGPSATRSFVLSQYAETLIRFKARQLARCRGLPAAVGRQLPLSRHHMRRAIRRIRRQLESAGLG